MVICVCSEIASFILSLPWQLQVFCLFKTALACVRYRNTLDIFNLNRSHILESLSFSWILAMFTNSLLVNSNQAWNKHRQKLDG